MCLILELNLSTIEEVSLKILTRGVSENGNIDIYCGTSIIIFSLTLGLTLFSETLPLPGQGTKYCKNMFNIVLLLPTQRRIILLFENICNYR